VILEVLAASVIAASAAAEVAKLDWMAGAWTRTEAGATVRETWLAPMDGVMAGAGQTNSPGRAPFIEHMKISAEPAGVTFTAILPGQPPTPFVLKPGGPDEAVFENLAHDFPQRVIYRRCGVDLCAAIEGMVAGKPKTQTWRYQRIK
jgi:Domain of unknown function (DUF6265)